VTTDVDTQPNENIPTERQLQQHVRSTNRANDWSIRNEGYKQLNGIAQHLASLDSSDPSVLQLTPKLFAAALIGVDDPHFRVLETALDTMSSVIQLRLKHHGYNLGDLLHALLRIRSDPGYRHKSHLMNKCSGIWALLLEYIEHDQIWDHLIKLLTGKEGCPDKYRATVLSWVQEILEVDGSMLANVTGKFIIFLL